MKLYISRAKKQLQDIRDRINGILSDPKDYDFRYVGSILRDSVNLANAINKEYPDLVDMTVFITKNYAGYINELSNALENAADYIVYSSSSSSSSSVSDVSTSSVSDVSTSSVSDVSTSSVSDSSSSSSSVSG